ncbi:hypothetical protein GCM10025786_29650 [Nocardioides caeni]
MLSGWSRRRWLVVGLTLALVVVAAVVVWRVVGGEDRTRFAEAVALAPASTARFSWTDWAGVRDELDADLSASSSTQDIEDFLLEAFDRDLAPVSALEESAPAIHADLGFSPATIDWELFAQGEDGAVVIIGLPEDFDVERVRNRLRGVGFEEPDDADGVWRGGADLLQGLSGPVTPELAAIQIDEDAGLLLGSDDPDFLAARAGDARGDREDGISDVVDAAGEALSASAYTGDYTCAELSMTTSPDPADQTRAAELIEEAGGIHPVAGYAIAARPDGDIRVTLAFENEDQARADADSRSQLAAGPALGQGGAFADSFTVARASARGRVVTLDLAPEPDAFVLSNFNHGPVLFATC